MRARSTLLGLSFVVTAAVSTQACIGDDTPPITEASDASASSTDSATPDAGAAAPTCQSDQLLCNGACVPVGPANCGACGAVCPSTAPLCSSGAGTAPTCVATCEPGTTKCGEQCVDTATNPSNCGACGEKCTTPSNGVATCANSTCDFSCKTNFHACGADCAADDDVNKCGPTCKTCTAPANGTAVCNGACSFTCSGGLTACVTENVCANTQLDKNNCGACGKVCQIASACTTGQCNVKLGNTTLLAEACVADGTQFNAIPVTIAAPITVTHLGIHIIQFASQYDIWLGLYANNGGKPGALLASAKSVITGNGAKELPVTSTNIAAGTYFVGLVPSSFAKYGCSSTVGTYEWFDNGAGSIFNAGAAPNPAPATTTLTGTSNFWLVGRE